MTEPRCGILRRLGLATVACLLACALATGCKRNAAPPKTPPDPLEALKKTVAELPLPSAAALDPMVREQLEVNFALLTKMADPAATPQAAFSIARLLHGQGHLEFARDWYGFVLELLKRDGFKRFDDDEFLCWYYLADIAGAQERFDASLKALNAALALRERDVPALLMRAHLLRKLNAAGGQESSAASPDAQVRKAYESVLALEAVPEAHYGLGDLEALRKNPTTAEEHFRRALALAPNYHAARAALAALLRGLDRAGEADELLAAGSAEPEDTGFVDPHLQALRRTTSLHGLKLAHSLRLAISGRAEEAEVELRALLLAEPGDAEAWDLLGTIINAYRVDAVEARLRRLLVSEAKKCFLTAIEGDPRLFSARENYAMLLLQRENNRDLALEQLGEILVRDDGYWKAHFHMADILVHDPVESRRRESAQLAEQHYRKVIQHDSNNIDAYSELVSLIDAQGRSSEAHDLLREAVRVAPHDPGIANQLARFLLTCPKPELRDPVNALAITSRVNEVTNNLARLEFPEYLETLALAYIENAQLGGGRNLDMLSQAYDVIRKAIDSASAQKRQDLLPRLREMKAQVEGWLKEANRLPK
ncbi:MAG: tetratricopeptide repeat protein [Phycisphaerales bacterium]|nr:tetratricopeptide repeat protein [Phycisphaerales bacterium]